jgi:hypothetical protein
MLPLIRVPVTVAALAPPIARMNDSRNRSRFIRRELVFLLLDSDMFRNVRKPAKKVSGGFDFAGRIARRNAFVHEFLRQIHRRSGKCSGYFVAPELLRRKNLSITRFAW